jgi:hypothetical protein
MCHTHTAVVLRYAPLSSLLLSCSALALRSLAGLSRRRLRCKLERVEWVWAATCHFQQNINLPPTAPFPVEMRACQHTYRHKVRRSDSVVRCRFVDCHILQVASSFIIIRIYEQTNIIWQTTLCALASSHLLILLGASVWCLLDWIHGPLYLSLSSWAVKHLSMSL